MTNPFRPGIVYTVSLPILVCQKIKTLLWRIFFFTRH